MNVKEKRDRDETGFTKNTLRAPCSIGESQNFYNRFYLATLCRSKDEVRNKKLVNATQLLAEDKKKIFLIINIIKNKSLSPRRSKPETLITIFNNQKNKGFEAIYDKRLTMLLINKNV